MAKGNLEIDVTTHTKEKTHKEFPTNEQILKALQTVIDIEDNIIGLVLELKVDEIPKITTIAPAKKPKDK